MTRQQVLDLPEGGRVWVEIRRVRLRTGATERAYEGPASVSVGREHVTIDLGGAGIRVPVEEIGTDGAAWQGEYQIVFQEETDGNV